MSRIPSVAAWAAILICTTALYLRSPGNVNGKVPQDFAIYFHASERVVTGENPYLIEGEHAFKYAPGFLIPMQLLPKDPKSAWKIFGSLCLLAWAAALLLGARYRKWQEVGYLLLGLSISWKGLIEALDFGQLEFLLLLSTVISAKIWKKQPLLTGLILGSLPWIKLPWLFYIVPFLLVMTSAGDRRDLRRFLLGYYTSAFLWLALLPISFFGFSNTWKLLQNWLLVLRAQPGSLYFSDFNQGLWVFLQQFLTFTGAPYALAIGFTVLFGVWVTYSLFKRTQTFSRDRMELGWVSPWLILGQLLNPLAWRWGSLLLVGLPFSLSLHRLVRQKWMRIVLYTIAFALFLLQQNPVTQLFHLHWTALHSYRIITGYWLSWLFLVI